MKRIELYTKVCAACPNLLQALGYADIEETDVVDMNMKLLKVLNADGNQYNLTVANKLYGEQTIKFKQVFHSFFSSRSIE